MTLARMMAALGVWLTMGAAFAGAETIDPYRSEIAGLHGPDGTLEAVTLTDGTRLPLSFLFLFLGARPCTEWLGDAVARDDDGFILTGDAAGAANLLETSVPGIFAAGDVRSGSTKRCATAVGEGSMAVQFVHAHLASTSAEAVR